MAGRNTASIKAVLFDLGGVLVELRGEAHMMSLVGGRMTRDAMWHTWLHSPAVRLHETGRIGAEEFAREAIREFGLEIAPADFLTGFRAWVKAPFEGEHDLLRATGERYITALASNISAVHWPLIEAMGIPAAAHHVFASHLVGEIKPDAAYFAEALRRIGVAPHEAVFFDDNLINVEGARAVGIDAHRTMGVIETRNKLVELGMLERG